MTTKSVAAHVFLRSVSGRSARELGEGPLPADLSPYRAPSAARDEVYRHFERHGFRVFVDTDGLFFSIDGPPSLFAKVFAVAEQGLVDVPASKTTTLPVPANLQHLIAEIVVIPPPELLVNKGAL